jgi:mannose-1-phosphate guanylyltransferase
MFPLTASVPKALLPLAGVPFVEYQLRQLSRIGVDEVFLAVGRPLLDKWEDFVAGGVPGMKLHLAVEDQPLDTAGPVRAVLPDLQERFFVLNGDVILETDLAAVAESGWASTLGLVEVEDTSAYGVVVTGDDGRVERFVEKPPPAEAPAKTVSAGIYVLPRSALQQYEEGPLSFERVVFPALTAAGLIGGTLLTGEWIDIGTPALYLNAHAAVFAGGTSLNRPDTTHLADGATVDGKLAGDWAWVGEGAEVAEGAVVEESVILPGAQIEEGAVVRSAVIGWNATVGPGAVVTGATMVGARAQIGAGCELVGLRIAPGAVLPAGSVTVSPPE